MSISLAEALGAAHSPTLQTVTLLFRTMHTKQLAALRIHRPTTQAHFRVVISNMYSIGQYCRQVHMVMDSEQCAAMPEQQRIAYRIFATHISDTAFYLAERFNGAVGLSSPAANGIYIPASSEEQDEFHDQLNRLRTQMQHVCTDLWDVVERVGIDTVLEPNETIQRRARNALREQEDGFPPHGSERQRELADIELPATPYLGYAVPAGTLRDDEELSDDADDANNDWERSMGQAIAAELLLHQAGKEPNGPHKPI